MLVLSDTALEFFPLSARLYFSLHTAAEPAVRAAVKN